MRHARRTPELAHTSPPELAHTRRNDAPNRPTRPFLTLPDPTRPFLTRPRPSRGARPLTWCHPDSRRASYPSRHLPTHSHSFRSFLTSSHLFPPLSVHIVTLGGSPVTRRIWPGLRIIPGPETRDPRPETRDPGRATRDASRQRICVSGCSALNTEKRVGVFGRRNPRRVARIAPGGGLPRFAFRV
jgi:hypothetical protein